MSKLLIALFLAVLSSAALAVNSTPAPNNVSGTGVTGILPVANGGTGRTGITVANAVQHSIGDSITLGTGASPNKGFASDISWDLNSYIVNTGTNSAQACDIADLQTFANEQPSDTNNPLITLLEGTNDAIYGTAGAYESVYNACMESQLAWLAISSTYKVNGSAAGCVQAGSWATDAVYNAAGVNSHTNASTLTCTITTYGGTLYAWYRNADSDGGTFTYAVDGGATTSLATATSPAIATHNGGTHGVSLIRVSGLSAGSHSVVFNVTSSTSGSNNVDIIAVGTKPDPNAINWNPPAVFTGGVLKKYGDQNAANTAAYNVDALADAALIANDGLPVYAVNVRNYVNTSTDMNTNDVHPTDAGARHLANAFEEVMQTTPNYLKHPNNDATAIAIGNNVMTSLGTSSLSYNIGIGTNSLLNVTTGLNNEAIGHNACVSVTTGGSNACFGDFTNTTQTGSFNLALGSAALGSGTGAANQNIGIGYQAGYGISTGNNNIAIGHQAMIAGFVGANDITAGHNVSIGDFSAYHLQTTAANNTFIGDGAGGATTTGSNNLILGYQIGNTTITTGGHNILIGTDSGTGAGGADVITNSDSNKIVVGNLLFWSDKSVAAPTVSACGTNTIETHSNNAHGQVNITSGTPASCTITFAGSTPYATWVHCVVTAESTTASFQYSATTSAIVFTGTAMAGKYDYTCQGY